MLIKSTIKLIIGVVGGFGTAGGLIADFLMPVAPFGFYLGLSLFILFLLSIALAAVPWSNNALRNKFQGYWYLPIGLTILLLSTGMFGAYYFSNNENNNGQGWLASNIEAFSEIQQQLGLIQENTARTAKATESIDRKMDDIKKETSENPKKELANLGIEWSNSSFFRAVKSHDLETTELFLKGKMKITNKYLSSPIYFAVFNDPSGYYSDAMELFFKYGFDINSKVKVPYQTKEETLLNAAVYNLRKYHYNSEVIKKYKSIINHLIRSGATFEDALYTSKNTLQAIDAHNNIYTKLQLKCSTHEVTNDYEGGKILNSEPNWFSDLRNMFSCNKSKITVKSFKPCQFIHEQLICMKKTKAIELEISKSLER